MGNPLDPEEATTINVGSAFQLGDEDIFLRLTNTEDSTVERKTASDYRDCLKTAVAFSNSLPIGDPGIIFVGVYDDGRIEDNKNLDSLQKKVSEEINKVYPPIYPQIKGMNKDGREFLAVIVRGSENRPHFAGPALDRDASQTRVASEDQFTRLIAQRSSKAYEILKWRGKTITVDIINTENLRMVGRIASTSERKVIDCNQFHVTLQHSVDNIESFPLRRVEVGTI